jgi:hypothetical protein
LGRNVRFAFQPVLSDSRRLLKADVNFSNYDEPLYEQIVSRIKAKGAPRLGEGKNTRDRYFIVPFAYQNKELYPNGGLFGTGFKMWGINGTKRVLIEYNQENSEQRPAPRPGRYQGRSFRICVRTGTE